MNARNLTLPDRALSTLLASLSRRITVLERRIRWPGATLFDELTTPTPLIETLVGEVSPDYTTLCTVNAERGRYLIIAGTEVSSVAPAGMDFRIRAQVEVDGVPIAGAQDGGSTGGAATSYTSLVAISTINLPDPSVVALRAQYGIAFLDTGAEAIATNSYLIAVPS